MAVVSITRLRVRSKRFSLPFFVYTFRSALQLRRSPGFRRGALGGDAHNGNWTMTVWDSEEQMRAFRNAAPHMIAMKKLLDWCDEASYTHYTTDEPSLPDARHAYERLQAGRISKVNHPSEAHAFGHTVSASVPRFNLTLTPVRGGRTRGVRP